MQVEDKIFKILTQSINTKYNWSLILFSIIFWWIVTNLTYNAKANFDIIKELCHILIIFSGATLVASIIKPSDIMDYSLVTFVFSIFTFFLVKVFMLQLIGLYIFLPINIFIFLLLLKSIYLSI